LARKKASVLDLGAVADPGALVRLSRLRLQVTVEAAPQTLLREPPLLMLVAVAAEATVAPWEPVKLVEATVQTRGPLEVMVRQIAVLAVAEAVTLLRVVTVRLVL
jgi:hypothetical protein